MGLIVAGHPFDTVKVRLQSEGGFGRFRGPLDCLRTTLREEGVRGLYKGALAPLVGQGGVNAVMFATYGYVMSKVQADKSRRATLGEVWMSAAITGPIIATVVTPMEGIKARLQVQYSEMATGAKARYAGPVDCFMQIMRQPGLGLFRGIYRGFLPTVFCRFSYSYYMVGYEVTRRYLTEKSGGAALSPLATLAGGSVAGTAYWLACYPVDVIKNKIMAARDVHPPVYSGPVDCAKQIFAREGLRGFTRGFSVAIIRSVPANATAFLFLESAYKVLPRNLF